MSNTEPPFKKAKVQLDESFTAQNLDDYIQIIMESPKTIKMIIAEDLVNPVPLTNVYIGHIKEPSLISRTILLLNEKLPLKSLQHLKRVKGRDIILCPIDSLNSTLSIDKYLELNAPELIDVFEYFKDVAVPLLPPKVVSQFKEANKIWSVNFHPDKYLESIVNNTVFNDDESKSHRRHMSLTFEIAKWYISKNDTQADSVKDINVALVLDPVISSVVAVGIDNRIKHPMQHAAMLAIDNVAKTQNAGYWLSEEKRSNECSGIEKELYLYLKETFPSIKLGSRAFEKRNESSEKVPNGPYLCTGYYIYLMREPCVMCAMGLTHARINRTFFCFDNKKYGALKSKTMLHVNPFLNHRFEAFTGFL